VLLQTYDVELGTRSQVSTSTIFAPFRSGNWPRVRLLIEFIVRHHRDWRSTLKALVLAPRIVEVAEELTRTRPDVVHAFWGHYPSLLLPIVAKDMPGCVRSMFLGAYDMTSHLVPFSVPAAAMCQTVWTHSDDNLPTLRAIGIPAEKTMAVHRGIPLDLSTAHLPARENYRVCTAANFQKEKNIDLVLRAFRELTEIIPEATLSVVGDGDQRNALQSLSTSLGLGNRVTFTGRLSRQDLFREMARSHVFLFLSTKVSERLPNVVKEAMLAQCHCIVSDTPGIRELIEDGRTGEIVVDLNPGTIASRVANAMNRRDWTIGEEAAQFVRDNFSAEASMSRYVESWLASLATLQAGDDTAQQ
jgi:glycosyltransferase involved in cell wall biosynthesis